MTTQNDQQRKIPEHWTFDPADFREAQCHTEVEAWRKAAQEWDPHGPELYAPAPPELKETMRTKEGVRLCEEHLPEEYRPEFDRVWGAWNEANVWLDQRIDGNAPWRLSDDAQTWVESGEFDSALAAIKQRDEQEYGKSYGISEWYAERVEAELLTLVRELRNSPPTSPMDD